MPLTIDNEDYSVINVIEGRLGRQQGHPAVRSAWFLPGQRRLHMKDESDSRKRSIATAIAVEPGHGDDL